MIWATWLTFKVYVWIWPKGETVLVDIVSVHGEWLIRDHLVGGEQPIPYIKWRITWDLPEIGPITNQLIWLQSIEKQVGA